MTRNREVQPQVLRSNVESDDQTLNKVARIVGGGYLTASMTMLMNGALPTQSNLAKKTLGNKHPISLFSHWCFPDGIFLLGLPTGQTDCDLEGKRAH